MRPLHRVIRARARPLQPVPAGAAARLRRLPGVRAVAFDVYGTLLISAAGEPTGCAEPGNGTAACAAEAVAAAGIALPAAASGRLPAALGAEIARRRAAQRAAGVRYPDPDVRGAWRAVLRAAGAAPTTEQVERLAVEFELRANPAWPMPHALETLRELHGRAAIGIVSNAQFYTPLILRELLGASFDALIPPDRRVCSYRLGRAKPGVEPFEAASDRFAAAGIDRSECLFVGNDMRNDVGAAAACGWRTALFAGDARSLRLREDDERCRSLQPDLILTSLAQLPPLLR